MARPDWRYINIPMEQSNALDDIVKKIGKRNGISNRNELVKSIIRDYIEGYEEKHDLVQARKAVKMDGKHDA
jgi:metal-responsive CopG/Arc/MetJ family transcriptional regulator